MISTRQKKRKNVMKRVIFSMAFIATLLGGQAVEGWAQVTIHFNGDKVSANSLKECLENVKGSDPILTMKVTAGTFTEADWKTMYAEYKQKLAALTELEFAAEVTVEDVPDNNTYSKSKTIEKINFQGSTPQKLGKSAFNNFYALKEINLPKGLTEIGTEGLAGNSLKEIVIPDGVKSIGEYAFMACDKLEKVTLSQELETIGQQAFCDCKALKEIDIPESVTEIKSNAFDKCKMLEKVTLPKKLTLLAHSAFQACSELKEITIPENIKEIQSATFNGCSKLEQVNLPAGLTKIQSTAFQDCKALKEIVIPENVKTIGLMAFAGCSSLTKITCMIKKPPLLGTKVFEGLPSDWKLYIPQESMDAYKKADNWRDLEEHFNLLQPVYTVTFHFTEANGEPDPVIKTVKDDKVEMPKNPERDGYSFEGWTKTEGGDQADFDGTEVKENMDVYAVWKPIVLTVTFNTEGGSAVNAQSVNWGDALGDKMPANPTRKGYIFKGWNNQQDGQGESFDKETVVKKNITVYAIWEKEKEKETKSEDPKAGSEKKKKEKATAVESSLLAHTTVGPNPLGEYIVVRGVEKAQEYRITNLTGHTLLHGTLQGNANIRINTESLPAGVYILTLQATDGVTTFRIIKQ